MSALNETARERHPLAADNIAFLQQGLDLLAELNDEDYVRSFPPAFEYGIGSHIRHIVDHYQCFFSGLETGSIDYDQRARDSVIERERSAAIDVLRGLIAKLDALDATVHDKPLLAHMDCGTAPAQLRSATSAARELQFLVSHTVHHYALVAVIMRLEGREPVAGFGISPSTLRAWRVAPPR